MILHQKKSFWYDIFVMQIGTLEYYLLGINLFGFFLFLFNTWLYTHTKAIQLDLFVTIVSVFGGSLGIVLGMLILQSKAEKENMMSRVFVLCALMIQIIIYLVLKGVYRKTLTFAFWTYFQTHRLFSIYLLIMNIIAFIVYGVDKYKAIKDKARIRIVTLLGLAFIGGSLGSFVAMHLFRHKIRKDYFALGIPFIMVMQVVVLFYVMNL